MQPRSDRGQRFARVSVVGLDDQRLFELGHRLLQHSLRGVDTAEVAMRIMPGLVAHRYESALQPWNRLIQSAEMNEVGADVVVRVAELGVRRDGPLALRDGVIEAPVETVRPPEKRMRFSSGM